jgi:hypothetical protein
MNIALDYDGTMKRSSQYDITECKMWGDVIAAFKHVGHTVYIVTMRCGSTEDATEIAKFLNLGRCSHVDVIFCGEKGLKRAVCKEQGINIDIWIDDMPDMIGSLPILNV